MTYVAKYQLVLKSNPRPLTQRVFSRHPNKPVINYDVVDESLEHDVKSYVPYQESDKKILKQLVRGISVGSDNLDGRTVIWFGDDGEMLLSHFTNFHFTDNSWKGFGTELMNVTLRYIASIYSKKPPYNAEEISIKTHIQDSRAMRILMANGFRPKQMPVEMKDYFNRFDQLKNEIPYEEIREIINSDIGAYGLTARVIDLKNCFRLNPKGI